LAPNLQLLSKPLIMKRTATVTWQGAGKEGQGKVSTQSRAIDNANFAYDTRFENAKGTNPEELIAAAHASCFTMKLSFVLEEAGFKARDIKTSSSVHLEHGAITASHIIVHAKVDGISNEKFEELAEKTRVECPVSKALNLQITMDASLVNEHIET
jgi:lipoyl-dependent peroxiredoxin